MFGKSFPDVIEFAKKDKALEKQEEVKANEKRLEPWANSVVLS